MPTISEWVEFFDLDIVKGLIKDENILGVYDVYQKYYDHPQELTSMFRKFDIDVLNYLIQIPIKCFCGDSTLTEIVIPSVIEIRAAAFYDCENLKSIKFLDNRLAIIGDSAFMGCPLEKIEYPGTKKEWQAIDGLYKTGINEDCEIICSDSTINFI